MLRWRIDSKPQTMKLHGRVREQPVMVLIDSGASHNFISSKLVRNLGLKVETTQPYKVRLGDGNRRQTQGCCENLKVQLGNYAFEGKFFLFDLGEVDLILGIAWLATLGEVKVNWRTLTMQFMAQGRIVEIKGDPSLAKALISPQAFMKVTEVEAVPVLWEIQVEENSNIKEIGSQLPEIKRKELQGVIEKFQGVFATPEGLPPRREVDHKIPIKSGCDPVNVRPYRYPHLQKNEIEKQVKIMLETRIIRPSNSPYSSPVILVKKKDGSWRFCVDYRALNKATVPDKFPIPVIEELLDELSGAQYFSKVDLRAGYHQIRMHEEDIPKTAFRTHQGHYKSMVMPFGLTNAPATFQCAMNATLQPYLRRFVLVFFDDILIYSQTWEDHLEHLNQVLTTLQQHQYFANLKKCDFGQTEIKYLGHVISMRGVAMHPQKIEAILQWPIPKSIKALRGFLGLTGYYRRFVRNYGRIARPLTDLLKKGNFHWNEASEAAFKQLQNAVTTAPVLAMPDFTQPFCIECDASGKGLGAVLSQNKRPIAFFSKALTDSSLTKSVYEKELMALVLAIQHWRPYLLGRRFTVYTDQKSLRHLLDQRITTQNQQNWLAKLMGYEFDIIYKQGATNKVADALSRKFDDLELQPITRPYWQDVATIDKEVQRDPALRKIREGLQRNPDSQGNYTLENDRLYYKGRLVIAATSSWVPRLLNEYHSSPMGGHSGIFRTYRRIAQSLYWIGMKACSFLSNMPAKQVSGNVTRGSTSTPAHSECYMGRY